MKTFSFRFRSVLYAIIITTTLFAQERIEPLPFGDMENWTVRYIHESKLIGGKTKVVYALAPTDTIYGNHTYDFAANTIWGISNAYANVIGIAKAAVSTQPEKRGDGYCARLDTRMEDVRVFGMIDLQVCIVGTLFLGEVIEPIKSANDPYGSISMGIPFTEKPKALMLDFKSRVNPEHKIVKAIGVGKTIIDGHDEPEIYIFLQKRWEEPNGKIKAVRVGTARHRFSESIREWHNGYRININYGDISQEPYYKDYMGLFPLGGEFKAKNSKGKIVKIEEVGWANPDEEPTHVILMITGGCYPAFHGCPGNAIWVDNVKWVFEE